MAEYSEHYNLKKPSQDDFYNVDDFNDNADKIDMALYSAEQKLGQAAQESTLEGVKTDVTGVKADVADVKSNVAAVSNKIGTATDTGGSDKAGTVMGKLNVIFKNTADKFDLLPDSAFTEYVTSGFVIETTNPSGFLYEGKGLVIIGRYQNSGSNYGNIYVDGDTTGFNVKDMWNNNAARLKIKFKKSIKLMGLGSNGYIYVIMRKEGY